MRKLIRNFATNIYTTLLLLVVSLLSYFSDARTILGDLVKKVGITSTTTIDIISILFVSAVFLVFLTVFDKLKKQFRRSKLINYQDVAEIFFSPDGSGQRIVDFQQIRDSAKNTIYVMGVGMTYFSSDLSFLKNLLSHNINVRVLIQDSSIFDGVNGVNTILVSRSHFDDYFARTDYSLDIESSINRLRRFIESGKYRNKSGNGNIELRSYPYLLPLNYTMADEAGRGEFLLEFIIPFSDHRMRTKITKADNPEMYAMILSDLEEIWDKSNVVAKSS